jgi:transposase
MEHTTVSVDLAKSVFEIAVSTRPGRVTERHRLTRSGFARFFADRASSLVLLEACGTAHHWARELDRMGHKVLLLPPHRVRPHVTGNKTDRADAKALLEAYRDEDIRPVPVKSVLQQTLAAIHRLRSAWLRARTARINTLRGVLREFGIFIPVGSRQVVPAVLGLIEDADCPISDLLRPALWAACQEIRSYEANMLDAERQLKAAADQIPVVSRLLEIPGVGIITATALVAFVGNVERFRSARHFASYLGLTPRESSSGLRRRLGAISKRGDRYLRMLLTHGARATLRAARLEATPDRLRAWALIVEKRRGHNKAAIALANKLARIIWAVWKSGSGYREEALVS